MSQRLEHRVHSVESTTARSLLERAVEMGLWIRVSEKVIGGLKTNE